MMFIIKPCRLHRPWGRLGRDGKKCERLERQVGDIRLRRLQVMQECNSARGAMTHDFCADN